MNKYLYPGLLFLACLLLFTIPEPGTLRDLILDALLGAVLVLIPLHLIFTDKEYTDPHPALSYWIIGIAGAVLTGIFLFRITSGSYGFETGFGIRILKAFFFWMPAALFALLYRSDGEGWIPGKRSLILTRLLVAVAGSLAGLAASEFARSQIDSLPMGDALTHVESQLPAANNRIDFRHERSVLYLDVTLDPSFTEPNIHSLQRLRAISAHAANLTGRKDTDSLNLRIHSNDTELATLYWPDPETNRPTHRLRINYNGTGLSSLPAPGDLELLFGTVQETFRPKNLEASQDGAALILRWTGSMENTEEILKDPLEIPDLIHDWQAAGHVAIRAAALFEGIESIRLHMPGHSVSVAADSVNVLFRFQRLLPVADASVRIQIFDSEKMPELPESAGGAPVKILWGDGEFDTRRNKAGPLWPWERAILGGYEIHITALEADGTVHFVIHPFGRPEEARRMCLQPGQTEQLDSVYLRNVEQAFID
jgi:hypothetical protein